MKTGRLFSIRFFTILLGLFFVLSTSCSNSDDDPDEDNIENSGNENNENNENGGDNQNNEEGEEGTDDELNPNTQEVTFENAIAITFSDTTIGITNPFEDSGVTITNENGHVVIASTLVDTELNYVVSGVVSNGSLKIYGEYKFGLVLNGVGITNPDGAAINNQCGKKVTVTVVDNTNNRLIDGATYEQVENEDMKGTFFSEGQLNFYGSGKLEIRAKYKHAICTDDYFRMYAGNIVILEAASDGIHANDYIRMDDGKLTIRSTGEGLDCEKGYVMLNGGTLDIKTTGEKAHGIKSKEAITVDTDGTINVEVSGLASKGFKSGGDMTVSKGTIGIVTTGGAFYDTEDADISSAAGIKCDGNLLVDKGTITINSSGEGGKGISVDGTLIVNDGTITVTTTGGQFVYGSDDTAAKAIKSDGDLTVNGGTIIIKTSGVEAEGLESKATLTITGGLIEIEAYDDCINASTHIEITGGMVYCKSQVNDAIDSNGTLTISGGVVVAAGASAPEGGIDCDQSRFIMSGGTVIGIGGATSSPTTNVSTQRSLVYSPTSSSVQIIRIESSAGDEVLTFKLPVVYNQNMTMLFSSPSLVANTSYTIYTGGSISGGTDFHGLYTGATYTKGTSAATFTTSAMVTTVGNSNNPGVGGPGRP